MPSTCPACDGILDLAFEDKIKDHGLHGGLDSPGLWIWQNWLPACSSENRVTLGEGQSPLLRCAWLGDELGLSSLWVKNESIMPSGSFKDRALALATSLAKNYGRAGIILSSSGNAGASAAAYAARGGLAAVVLAPASAPRSKLAQIIVAGARLVAVNGNTSDCCRLAKTAAARFGWVNVTTTYYNPVGIDAYATIAYEIVGVRPDVVLLPISSGPLLAGVMKGFERLKRLGLTDKLPRPVAVQPSACAPTVRAFDTGKPVAPWTHQSTIASALNDTLSGYERDGDHTIAWIRRHGGCAVAVSDDDMLGAVRSLARREGIFVEPSAAAPIAAIKQLLASGRLGPDERVVAVTTGHGLKDVPDALLPEVPKPIAPDEGALAELLV
jgi:threonine synthase